MSLRRAVVLAAAGALIGATVVTTSAAAAQPPSDLAQDPQAMAANAATDLVASRPAALHASASETFTQQRVITSHGLRYVPYERTR